MEFLKTTLSKVTGPLLLLSKITATILSSALVLLYFYQSKLIYPSSIPQGSRTKVLTPDTFNLHNWKDVTLTTKDNLKIKAYSIFGAGNPEYTILYCHANAGNMGHRLPIAAYIMSKFNCNFFLFSYRGYGLSEGEPSEQGLKIDVETALDYLLTSDDFKSTKIVVYGQSIGGAVAIYLASKREKDISGLILENTFTSIPGLLPHILPYLRYFTFLVHQVWPSHKLIQSISTIPILFLSGLKDELIPPMHMRELSDLVRTARGKKMQSTKEKEEFEEDKHRIRFVTFRDGTHNDTPMMDGYFDAIAKFLQDLKSGKFEKKEL